MIVMEKILKLLLPKWIAEDLCARFTHPYWRRRSFSNESPQLSISRGITKKLEKTSSRRPFKRINEKKVLDLLSNDKVDKVLDVGCGMGNLVSYLTCKGFDAYGVTINPEEVEIANNQKVMLCDIQEEVSDGVLKGQQFDAVLSFDCIEHLESPLIALKNINSLIKEDGLFICYLPPARWTECDYHIVVYNPRQMRWLLNLSGFDLISNEGKHYFSKKGVTYYARKKTKGKQLYPGVLN